MPVTGPGRLTLREPTKQLRTFADRPGKHPGAAGVRTRIVSALEEHGTSAEEQQRKVFGVLITAMPEGSFPKAGEQS
jgi:hypothetical protein